MFLVLSVLLSFVILRTFLSTPFPYTTLFRSLFDLEGSADIFYFLAWANQVREHFKGNKIHLCSIVNIKAGGWLEIGRAPYELQSPMYLVCRLLLEKKKNRNLELFVYT